MHPDLSNDGYQGQGLAVKLNIAGKWESPAGGYGRITLDGDGSRRRKGNSAHRPGRGRRVRQGVSHGIQKEKKESLRPTFSRIAEIVNRWTSRSPSNSSPLRPCVPGASIQYRSRIPPG